MILLFNVYKNNIPVPDVFSPFGSGKGGRLNVLYCRNLTLQLGENSEC